MMRLDPAAHVVANVMKQLPSPKRIKDLASVIAQPKTNNLKPWASAAAMLAVGFFAGSLWFNNAPTLHDDWRLEVAHYQALYVNDTVAPLIGETEELSVQFETASAKLGYDLPQAALDQLDQLDLRRAQVLGFNDRALIQIVYADKMGTPIALCIMTKSDGTKATAPKGEMLLNMASASWANDTHEFILIGGQDQGLIDQTAADLAATVFHNG